LIKILSKQLILLCGFLVISTSIVYGADPVAELQVIPEVQIDFGELEAYSKTVKTESITITNCGEPNSILCWEVVVAPDPESENWLTIEGETTGEINLEAGDSKYTDVSLGACALCVDEAGIHDGEFYVYQYDYDYSATPGPACTSTVVDSVGPIEATMILPEFNVLEASPEGLDFGENIEEMALSITNAGEGEMEWEATLVIAEGVTWLTIDGETGTSGTTGSAETDTITVRVDRSALEGCTYEYSASIKIIATNALPEEVTVFVTMNKNIIPQIPKMPTPVDGAADQSLYSTLSWKEGETSETAEGIAKYDVYFSSNQVLVESNNPSALICDDIAVPYCDPSGGGGQLNENTTYYWAVKAIDDCQGNTVDSGIWIFTTGEAPPPINNCLISSLLSLSNNEITTLRRFRDEVLVESYKGEKYIDLYYSYHTVEALLIMLFNPELRMCANRIVKESLPAIKAHLRGEIAPIDTGVVEDMELFLEQFGKSASPGLKRVIRIMKKDIAQGDLFKDLGFSIVK